MCSAVRRRMLVKGTTCRRSPAATASGAARRWTGRWRAALGPAPGGRGGRRRRRCAAGGAGRRVAPARWPPSVPRRSIRARTSSRVMRPPAPVPSIWDGSRLCSAISRRTTGDRTLLDPLPLRSRGHSGGVRRPVGSRPPPPGLPTAGRCPLEGIGGRGWRERWRRLMRARPRLASRLPWRRFGLPGRLGFLRLRLGHCPTARPRLRRASGDGGRGRSVGGRSARDHGQLGADVDGLALGYEDLGDVAGHRRRHLGVHLVGRDLEEHLVLGDLVADLLQPAGDRALGDGLAQLGHGDVSQRGAPFRSAPGPSRRRSPTGSGGAG